MVKPTRSSQKLDARIQLEKLVACIEIFSYNSSKQHNKRNYLRPRTGPNEVQLRLYRPELLRLSLRSCRSELLYEFLEDPSVLLRPCLFS